MVTFTKSAAYFIYDIPSQNAVFTLLVDIVASAKPPYWRLRKEGVYLRKRFSVILQTKENAPHARTRYTYTLTRPQLYSSKRTVQSSSFVNIITMPPYGSSLNIDQESKSRLFYKSKASSTIIHQHNY